MKRIINLTLFFMFMLSLASCLKDKNYADGIIGHKVGNQNVIELAWPNSHDFEIKKALDIVNKDTSLRLIPVRLSSGKTADRDITITLDTTLTSDYINENIEDFPNLRHFNSTIGTLESGLTVTIPKGSNEGYVLVKVNTSKFNPSDQYVIGFAIDNIGDATNYTISGNLNSAVILLSAKNRFDAIYRVTGTMIDYANPLFTGAYPHEYLLISQGPNTIAMYDDTWFGNYIHTMRNNGGASGYGSFAPVFTIDLNTGVVLSVTNYYGQPAGNGRSCEIDPSGINKYDFATKSMRVKYWMNQPAVFTPHRVAFDETFTYIGPR